MITYIELWKAKDAWINLSKEERANYAQHRARNTIITGQWGPDG